MNLNVFLVIDCLVFGSIQTAVDWTLVKTPMVLNKNVMLKCHVQNCCQEDSARQWIGGPNNKVISSNEVTGNKAKYSVQRSGDGFTLTILDFDIIDANQIYTCSYGFDQYTANLSLANGVYEEESVKSNITVLERHMTGYIQFDKVYPEPKCHLMLNGDVLYSAKTDFEFYLANVSIDYTITNSVCEDRQFIVTCTIGNGSVNISNITLPSNCTEIQSTDIHTATPTGNDTTTAIELNKDKEENDSHLGWYAALIVLVVLIIVAIAVGILFKCPKIRNNIKECTSISNCKSNSRNSEKGTTAELQNLPVN